MGTCAVPDFPYGHPDAKSIDRDGTPLPETNRQAASPSAGAERLATSGGGIDPKPPTSEHDSRDDPGLYSDVAALLDGTLPQPPKPALLTRTDGHALLYARRV